MTEVAVPTAPPLVTVPNVELMHTGQWPISTGVANFTSGDLASAVAALDCPSVRRPVLKLGHSEPDPDENGMRWDGEPAVGYVANMAVVENGQTLVGDYAGLPAWLGQEVLASAYPDRSIEGWYDFRCQIGHTHPFVITAVALLGVTPPGIGTLQSLQDVAALYGVAASTPAAAPDDGAPVSITVHAAREDAVPNPRPTEIRAGVTSDDVRRAFYSSDFGRGWDIWITEMQLGPQLQLIVVDDSTGKLQRVPITIGEGDGEDAVEFADPVPVVVRYEDAEVAAAAAHASGARPAIRYASREEARPGLPPGVTEVPNTSGKPEPVLTEEHLANVRAAAVSDTPWSDIPESDYDIGQWHRACLIHTHDGDPTAKDQCKLPVREPDGTLNRNAVHAAAGGHGVGAVQGITDAQREAAAKELVRLYENELDEEPPESLLELADMDDDEEDAANAAASAQADAGRPARATPDSPAAAGAPSQEGAGMDPVALREALGLQPEASDDEVRAALTTEGVLTPTDPAPADTDPDPEAEPGEPDAGTDDPPSDTAPTLPPGTVTIDEATLTELREQAQQGVAARAQQRVEERNRVLDAAIRAGKFPPARRDHWATYWDRDEEGARATINDLAEGLVPVEDAGTPGGEPTDSFDEFDRLFSAPVPKGA